MTEGRQAQTPEANLIEFLAKEKDSLIERVSELFEELDFDIEEHPEAEKEDVTVLDVAIDSASLRQIQARPSESELQCTAKVVFALDTRVDDLDYMVKEQERKETVRLTTSTEIIFEVTVSLVGNPIQPEGIEHLVIVEPTTVEVVRSECEETRLKSWKEDY